VLAIILAIVACYFVTAEVAKRCFFRSQHG